jgi:hypothetical protein
LTLPPPGGHAVWLQAYFPLSRVGRLRALLYKPPQLALVTTDGMHRESRYRLIPAIAADGFLLQPLLETAEDYAAFVRGVGAKWLSDIRFEPAPGEAEFWLNGTVRLFEIPELPVSSTGLMQEYVDAGIMNRAPLGVSSGVAVELFRLNGEGALMVHAPGEIGFAPKSDWRRLVGHFGFRDGAYSNGGHTPGAIFVVEAQGRDGQVATLWRRVLLPTSREADRGDQQISLDLPRDIQRLTLRTLPAVPGDARWAWTYWRHLDFSP